LPLLLPWTKTTAAVHRQLCVSGDGGLQRQQQQSLLMEETVDGSSGNGIFATAVNADDGMVAVASIATAQLTMTTAIAATTIGRQRYCCQCHCIIIPPSHHHLRQWQPPSTKTIIAASVDDDRHCLRQQRITTTSFWRSWLITVWQRQWGSLMAAIAVVVDDGSGGIEPTAPMAASSTVAAVDGGSNDGVFTDASHDNNCHPCPHRPCPRPS
jgi:hypothetical protein